MRDVDKMEALRELGRLHNSCTQPRLKKLSKIIAAEAEKERDRVMLAKGATILDAKGKQQFAEVPENQKMGIINRQSLNDEYMLFSLFAKNPHTQELHFKLDVVKLVYCVGKPMTVPVGGTEGVIPKVDGGRFENVIRELITGTVRSIIDALAGTVEGGPDVTGTRDAAEATEDDDGETEGNGCGSLLQEPEGDGNPQDEGNSEPQQEGAV